MPHLLSNLHPLQVQIYREMDAGRKLQIVMQLLVTARELKRAGIKSRHPHLSEAEVEDRLREIFLYGR